MPRFVPWLVIALLGGCSLELAPLVADPPDGSWRHGGAAGSSGSAGGIGGIGALGGQGGTLPDASAGNSGLAGDGGATGGESGAGGAAGESAGGGTGGALGLQCISIALIDVDGVPPANDCSVPDQSACTCLGCKQYCFNPYGNPWDASDCVCPSCASDIEGCADPNHCYKDGLCDPYSEGCQCADCANHPLCK